MNIGKRIATMDDERLVDVVGDLDVIAQGGFLCVTRRQVAVEVEPGLADRSDTGGEGFDLGALLWPRRRLMGVKPGCGHDPITELVGQLQ